MAESQSDTTPVLASCLALLHSAGTGDRGAG